MASSSSSIRPSFSSFTLPSLHSCNTSQKLSFFHLGSGVRHSRNFGLKSSRSYRNDGCGTRVMAAASGNLSLAATQENALEWAKLDRRKMLHVVYRVGDLDKSIKFYRECLGMKVLRRQEMPDDRYTNVFLGYGHEHSHFSIELTYNYGIDNYDIGTGFGHFGLALDDIKRIVNIARLRGGKVIREPGPDEGSSSDIAFIEDPDGYQFQLLERSPSREPLCQVMLRVGDLDRSIKFYEKAFGMDLHRKRDYPESKCTIAVLGYGPEEKSPVLALTYNYGVTKYDLGDAYAQLTIGTDNVYKTAEAIKLAGGTITREPGPVPGRDTHITVCEDPDGWKTVFVDNVDFLKELDR